MTSPKTRTSGERSDQPSVLIATNPKDSDSFLVEEALRRKGVCVNLVHFSDFPSFATASLSVDSGDERADRWGFSDRQGPFPLPATIWWRRPGRPMAPPAVHPEDQEFVQQETRKFLGGLWQHLPSRTTYVNSPTHALVADRKPYQLRVARDLGFKIPPTLFSNDPAVIRIAIRNWGGTAAYKPFGSTGSFWLDDVRRKVVGLYTTKISEDDLPDDQTLSLTPGIFQPLLPKRFELRLTAFGSTVFATKIHSQAQERSRIDWRNGQRTLHYEAIDTPADLKKLCIALLRRLGLLMGCFDFIVTPNEEIYFLEVNEGGQFLWVESASEAPLLDAFSDFLADPKASFRWKRPSSPLRLGDVRSAAAERMAAASALHGNPDLSAVPFHP